MRLFSFHRWFQGKRRTSTTPNCRPRTPRLALEALEDRLLLSAGPAQPYPANLPAVAYAITHSPEYYGNFLTTTYQTYLGRTPDDAGLQNWVNAMSHGLTDEQVLAGFVGSNEYIQDHGGSGAGWIQGMYRNLLGRTPAQSEVNGWLAALNQGMTPAQVAYGFAASAERETQRVEVDYDAFVNRWGSPQEIGGWVNAFQHGATNEAVVAGFLGSPEAYAKCGGNVQDWLVTAYRETLNRSPGSDELESWEAVLRPGAPAQSQFQVAPGDIGQSTPTWDTTSTSVTSDTIHPVGDHVFDTMLNPRPLTGQWAPLGDTPPSSDGDGYVALTPIVATLPIAERQRLRTQGLLYDLEKPVGAPDPAGTNPASQCWVVAADDRLIDMSVQAYGWDWTNNLPAAEQQRVLNLGLANLEQEDISLFSWFGSCHQFPDDLVFDMTDGTLSRQAAAQAVRDQDGEFDQAYVSCLEQYGLGDWVDHVPDADRARILDLAAHADQWINQLPASEQTKVLEVGLWGQGDEALGQGRLGAIALAMQAGMQIQSDGLQTPATPVDTNPVPVSGTVLTDPWTGKALVQWQAGTYQAGDNGNPGGPGQVWWGGNWMDPAEATERIREGLEADVQRAAESQAFQQQSVQLSEQWMQNRVVELQTEAAQEKAYQAILDKNEAMIEKLREGRPVEEWQAINQALEDIHMNGPNADSLQWAQDLAHGLFQVTQERTQQESQMWQDAAARNEMIGNFLQKVAMVGQFAGTAVENILFPASHGYFTGLIYGAAGNWDKGPGGMLASGALSALGNVLGSWVNLGTNATVLGNILGNASGNALIAAGTSWIQGGSQDDMKTAALWGFGLGGFFTTLMHGAGYVSGTGETSVPSENDLVNAVEANKLATKQVIPMDQQSGTVQDLATTMRQIEVTDSSGNPVTKTYVDARGALEQLADTAASRTAKQAPADVQQAIINTRQDLIYQPADDATVAAVKNNPDFQGWQRQNGLFADPEMDSFQTPGKNGPSLGADRDARLVVVAADGSKVEVPRQLWENQAYQDFYNQTSQMYPQSMLTPEAMPELFERVNNLQYLKGMGLTDDQIMARAWAEEHNQLFTDRYHIEASADNSDQFASVAKIELPDPGNMYGNKPPSDIVIDRYTGDANVISVAKNVELADPTDYARMWQQKIQAYTEVGNNAEAIAQCQKGIAEMLAVRQRYLIKGLAAPDLAPVMREAMGVVLNADVGVTAANSIPDVTATLQNLGFRDLQDALVKIVSQNEGLKWSVRFAQ
jgi:hypothetical protein